MKIYPAPVILDTDRDAMTSQERQAHQEGETLTACEEAGRAASQGYAALELALLRAENALACHEQRLRGGWANEAQASALERFSKRLACLLTNLEEELAELESHA